ncbi:helix-hairpin-helix domain-containing protein [Streptomyces genisteinicus]|uniref:Helix-hairpin-helix domain-containing protein n=1 Tax=Streptomyces genisteinicus TaxID=2768068 RepID=A0A7H0I3G6_9ACTN|nr:helix-hairpin-helix domain-containing protein [Streptomyces genisteinicus]
MPRADAGAAEAEGSGPGEGRGRGDPVPGAGPAGSDGAGGLPLPDAGALRGHPGTAADAGSGGGPRGSSAWPERPPSLRAGHDGSDGTPEPAAAGGPPYGGLPDERHVPGEPPVPEDGHGPTRASRLRQAARDRLPLWVRLHCGLERRTLAALGVVLAAAALFAAQHFWSGRPQQVAVPEVVGREAVAAAVAEDTPVAPDPSPDTAGPDMASPGTGARIVVDVSGTVRRPGVLRLPAGARVEDALAAAGGAERGTDLTGLNRARVLTDGEHVVVGLPGTAFAAGAPAASAGTAAGAPAAPVSLNSATAAQLETLPGVGPVLAQHIVDHRTRTGGFRSVDELREVNGIGDRRFADLRNRVRP